MTTLTERVSKRSMSFANQRRAYLLRTVKKESYERIAEQVVNLDGEHPSWGHVHDWCKSLSVSKGCKPYKYYKCGRNPWKLTTDVQKFVLRHLIADRMSSVVTSTSLAEAVAREKGVVLEASCIRKFLTKRGYKWLPRSQKRKYSKEHMVLRLRFAMAAVRLTKKAFREELAASIDGVVLSRPPEDATDRFNYCVGGFHYMWRKPVRATVRHLLAQTLSTSRSLWRGRFRFGVDCQRTDSSHFSGMKRRRPTARSGQRPCARGRFQALFGSLTHVGEVGHGQCSATTKASFGLGFAWRPTRRSVSSSGGCLRSLLISAPSKCSGDG